MSLYIVSISCQEDNLQKVEIVEAKNVSTSEQVSYAHDNLLTLGNAVMSLASDAEFKKSLYTGIEKAFDGDKNILIKDLSAIKTKGGRIGDKFNQTLTRI